MAIVALFRNLFHLCLIKADTASEAIPMITLNTNPSIPLLLLMVWSNFGKKIGISTRNIT